VICPDAFTEIPRGIQLWSDDHPHLFPVVVVRGGQPANQSIPQARVRMGHFMTEPQRWSLRTATGVPESAVRIPRDGVVRRIVLIVTVIDVVNVVHRGGVIEVLDDLRHAWIMLQIGNCGVVVRRISIDDNLQAARISEADRVATYVCICRPGAAPESQRIALDIAPGGAIVVAEVVVVEPGTSDWKNLLIALWE
jgi:hypothetical protein